MSWKDAVGMIKAVSSGPNQDDIINSLPSVLSYTSSKRSMVILREIERMYGHHLSIPNVHLALQTAQREGWVGYEIIIVPKLWGRRNVETPAYFKIGSGRRVMTTNVMTEWINESPEAPPQTAYAQKS